MLLLAAVFGVLLPVPMAFDVVVCSVLLNAGMPPYLVAVLLVTLGSYSIYAWSLLGTTLSWRIAGLAAAAMLATGVLAGVDRRGARPLERPLPGTGDGGAHRRASARAGAAGAAGGPIGSGIQALAAPLAACPPGLRRRDGSSSGTRRSSRG